MRIRTLLAALSVSLSTIAPALGWAQTPAAPVRDGKADGRADYQIGPEDVLDVAVWNNTSLSKTTPVRPDGNISLPLLNDIQAAGLTPMQLRDVITNKLTEYMPN